MVRPADESRPVAKMAEVRGVQPAFPLYGAVELQDGRPYSHALAEGARRAGAPGTAGAARLPGGRRHPDRDVAASRSAASSSPSPGAGCGGFSFGPRVLVDAADLEGTGLLGFGSRVEPRPSAEGAAAGGRTADETTARGPARAVRERALVPRHRGPGGRGPVAGRELPEPRRPRHRDPRRHRRVERDAGLRSAEGPEHRGAQVPRGDEPAGVRGVPRAGAAARAGRMRAGRRRLPRPAWRRCRGCWPGSPVCQPSRTR